jgi:hypothetical protein
MKQKLKCNNIMSKMIKSKENCISEEIGETVIMNLTENPFEKRVNKKQDKELKRTRNSLKDTTSLNCNGEVEMLHYDEQCGGSKQQCTIPLEPKTNSYINASTSTCDMSKKNYFEYQSKENNFIMGEDVNCSLITKPDQNLNKNQNLLIFQKSIQNNKEIDQIHKFKPFLKDEKNVFKDKIINRELISEVYSSLAEETQISPRNVIDYLSNKRSQINEKMRAVVINWLFDVHSNFKLKEHSLFLTIEIIDTYLSREYINSSNLQLLGITSLYIACKFQEVFVPELACFVMVTADTYSKEEILEMEMRILKSLEYKIYSPLSFEFFQILSINYKFLESDYFLGLYILELFMLDYSSIYYDHLLLACSVIYLVMKFFPQRFNDYKTIKNFCFSNEKALKECARKMLYIYTNIEKTGFLSLKNKFCKKPMHEGEN